MPQPERARLPVSLSPAQAWPEVVALVSQFVHRRAVSMADVVVLVPFVQLLPLARKAFAAVQGWQPRVETSASLAASLSAPCADDGNGLSGRASVDCLRAAAQLRGQPWARAWLEADPKGHAALAAHWLQAAQALRERSATLCPGQRTSWWHQVHECIEAMPATQLLEAHALAGSAAWAQHSATPPTDVLYACHPAAWVVLQAGGADPLLQQLLQDSPAPSLWIDADSDTASPFAEVLGAGELKRLCCADFETEALAATSQAIDAVNAGLAPVALVAQDRALARRIRSLLERQSVPWADETGWKLSTTRAATALMAWLQAAQASAVSDERLAWLKSGACPPGLASGIDPLEAAWRRQAGTPGRVVSLPPSAQAVQSWAAQQLEPLANMTAMPLPQALALWCTALHESGHWLSLARDAAGAQVLRALCLHEAAENDQAWLAAAAHHSVDLAGLLQWADEALERTLYYPEAQPHAQVVFLPMEQAVLRPFGAVVVPGCDARNLGMGSATTGWLSEPMLRNLGMPGRVQRFQREGQLLAQLLRNRQVVFLRRLQDDRGPVGESPWLQWLQLTATQAKLTLEPEVTWQAPTAELQLLAHTSAEPRAPDLLPGSLSASALQDLRDCPYRFYASRMLGLGVDEELARTPDARDYGNLLHQVLLHFHLHRCADGQDAQALQQASAAVSAQWALPQGLWLPYEASFQAFAPHYLLWLHEREAAGMRFTLGEKALQVQPAQWGGTLLKGVIDRVDERGGATTVRQLLDYKTQRANDLRQRVADPAEDTQLATYAALSTLALGHHGELQAAYLSVGRNEAPNEVVHAQPARTAELLLQEIGYELNLLRSGAPLPALGEGRACEYCEAKGLCRRDERH